MTQRELALENALKLIRKMYRLNPVMREIIDSSLAGDYTVAEKLAAKLPTAEELASFGSGERIA